jgi:hypothetical protein
MANLQHSDMYIGPTDPTNDINPGTVGSIWINSTTGIHSVCTENDKDKNTWKSLIDIIYPVGSMYITVADIDPNKVFGGTWRKEAGDKTIWLSDSNAGEEIEAGLPNIKGTLNGGSIDAWRYTGPFKVYYNGVHYVAGGSGGWRLTYSDFDASRCSPIYKDDCNTVQPPAIRVYCWIREA